MKNSVDTIKALAYILFLIVVVVLANIPAHAYEIKGHLAALRHRNQFSDPERDRRKPDRPPPGQPRQPGAGRQFHLQADSGNGLHDHSAWVDWTLPIRQTLPSTARRPTRKPLTAPGGRSVGPVMRGQDRCSDLSKVGTLTVEAKVLVFG